MYFIGMLIELRREKHAQPLGIADCRHINAMLHHVISSANPSSGKILHDTQRFKQFSLALLRTTPQSATIRATFVADAEIDYANTFICALAEQTEIRLGRSHFNVAHIDLNQTDWAGIYTWSDLLSQPLGSRIRFDFITPTALTKQDEQRERVIELLPQPNTVFMSLARRWRALNGPALPIDLDKFLNTQGCVTSGLSLHDTSFKGNHFVQKGILGYIIYTIRKNDSNYLASLNHLARMAAFTGIGYQTARGMGTVRVLISD